MWFLHSNTSKTKCFQNLVEVRQHPTHALYMFFYFNKMQTNEIIFIPIKNKLNISRDSK